MSVRRQIIAALSEDSLGGIATLQDVTHAEQLVDAHRTEAFAEGARLLEDAACDADWTRTPDFCTGLRAGAELLLANTEKATAAAATATPGFFQAGCSYVSGTWQFRCEAITPSPGTGEIRALGWKRAPVHDVHLWHAAALDPDDWAHGGWADITKDGSQ